MKTKQNKHTSNQKTHTKPPNLHITNVSSVDGGLGGGVMSLLSLNFHNSIMCYEFQERENKNKVFQNNTSKFT